MVLRGHIDFKTDPWPKLSDAAKDCVKRLLEQVSRSLYTMARMIAHYISVVANSDLLTLT